MPKQHMMVCSRAIPVDVTTAFHRTLSMPLTTIFSRWYGPLGPVRAVHQYRDGEWGAVGQARSVVQAGGTTLKEELTHVDPPHEFAYRLSHIKGPLAVIVDHIDGQWLFAPVGTGTEVTWRWTVHPTSDAAAHALPVLARLWQGFARQSLERLSGELLR